MGVMEVRRVRCPVNWLDWRKCGRNSAGVKWEKTRGHPFGPVVSSVVVISVNGRIAMYSRTPTRKADREFVWRYAATAPPSTPYLLRANCLM